MADDTYVVNEIATGTTTITLTDDGSGIDTLKVTGVYTEVVEFTLAWTSDALGPLSASGFYFTSNGSGNIGHRLIVNGVIENATGSDGEDFIQGNILANLIFGDALASGAGLSDTLWGSAGNDTIYGGEGQDDILGDGDDDLLFGNAGSDTISGGSGIDTVEGGAGADNLAGGAAIGDTVSYVSSSAGVSIEITFGSFTTGHGGDAEGDTIGGFPNIIGSAHGDVLVDTVLGQVAFGGNDNQFQGGAGNDILTLGGGADSGFGGGDNDTLDGGGHNDQLFGGVGRDSLLGGDGDDLLDGNAGGDTMHGGTGNDRFIVDVNTDIIVESVNEGTDTVVSGVNWTLGGTLENLVLTGTAVTGSGNNAANDLTGNALDNVLNGAGQDDTLHGGDGNDRLNGGQGNDVMHGDVGADTMTGGTGDDIYHCLENTDIVVEAINEGRDHVFSAVTWTLSGTLEDLTLTGTASNGTGNNATNNLTGNALANVLRGGGEADTLAGMSGNDSLFGDAGDDRMTGGKGVDTVTGGLGADLFVFANLSDFGRAPGLTETIADFSAAQGDKIDLSGVDAKSGPSNQAFAFIGAAAFSGVKGELRAVVSGANLRITGDVDGDMTADFALLLIGVTSITAANFDL